MAEESTNFHITPAGNLEFVQKAVDQKKEWDLMAEAGFRGGVSAYDRKMVQAYLRDHFFTQLSPTDRILNLAVGNQSYFRPTLPNPIVSSDLSEKMLAGLVNHDQKVVANATKLPYAPNTFDQVLNTFMMRYLTKVQQIQALSEFIRVTKPNGRITVIDFDQVQYHLEVATFDPNILVEAADKIATKLEKKVSCRVEQIKSVFDDHEGTETNMYAVEIRIVD